MQNLIDSQIGLVNKGWTEFDAWVKVLNQTQLKQLKAYSSKDYDAVKKFSSEIDFIQKQITNIK